MITKEIAIPLSWHPWSSSSRVIHWLTRNHGKIATLCKGALRPKSPFLGEYDLFSNSEILFFSRNRNGLYLAKECAMVTARNAFRTDWKSTLIASYLSALIARTTPEGAPLPELFAFYDELLDLTVIYGKEPSFIYWAELKLLEQLGQSPHLQSCILCSAKSDLRFSITNGGVVCKACLNANKLNAIISPPDILAMLRRWQQADTPHSAANTQLSANQQQQLNNILQAFITEHLHIPPQIRTCTNVCAL